MVQSPSGSGPTGKITYRNIPKLDDFLSGQTTSLDRTTAGLIQNPNFKLGDFLQGIDQELERVRRKYPNIDVDTNLQRFKWQWHHINPDKMPVDFYVGLNNVNDRDLITDTLLSETNVSAGRIISLPIVTSVADVAKLKYNSTALYTPICDVFSSKLKCIVSVLEVPP